ncbi:pre-16S rRNA-processing nuclease YqgF [Anaerospora hongkongensis]|uniref:pre-16S rRNA-processing nuclease YqgF n=1 Tax=Anaerospora hongkongensis TaxID=244830 RepID=UPI00289DB439|nr:pre-16S rRNA-processing nuclease YqgF [Anaerospora hongkongensis]
MSQYIIAVDPGREKCGIAVVNSSEDAVLQRVVETTELVSCVRQLAERYAALTVILGDGTAHQQAETELRGVQVGDKLLNVELINEKHSTEEARHLYWKYNPPKGLKRLIPVSMQVPPEPVDGYVAIILAHRYLRGGRR